MSNKKITASRLAELSVLTAAALILFVVELRLPPITETIPGVKPGLANIMTVVCVYRYRPYETALVVMTRVILGSFFASSFTTILFSAAGAFLCLAGMIPAAKLLHNIPIWVCSIIGAVLHNIGQTAAAVIYMGSFAAVGYLPVLLLSGCIAGAFTGMCAQFVIGRIGNRMK